MTREEATKKLIAAFEKYMDEHRAWRWKGMKFEGSKMLDDQLLTECAGHYDKREIAEKEMMAAAKEFTTAGGDWSEL